MLLFPALQLTVTYPKATASADGFEILAIIPILALVFTVLVHLACAIAVSDDCSRYRKEMGDTVFLSRFIWVVIALLTGPIGLAIYWVMHRSTINPANQAGVET